MAKFKITGLPKAQYGKNKITLEASPFSLNANQAQLASSVYGEYDPEFLIGASRPIGGSRDPRIANSLSLTAGLPLNGTALPSINAGYKFRYRPSSMGAGAFAPTTQLDVGAGWDPTQGLNFQAKANPRWEFANRSADAYLKHNWPVGAWRGYAGPSGGINLRQNSFVTGPAAYETSEKTAGNLNLFYGAEAGIEGRPFKKTPLRVGLDASLLMNMAKKQAEQSFNPDTDFNKSATGFTPMIKAKVVYPLGTKFPKKKEESEEKIRLDAIKANDKNYVVDAPVITGPGVDWDYKEKQQQSGTPRGYLPGYEPETGNKLSEEEVMRRYNYGPTLEYGGTSDGIYLDLDDDEIEQYKQGGYIVEELPKAQFGKNKRKKDPNQPIETATSIMSGTEPVTPNVVQPGTDAFDLNVGTVNHDPLLTAAWNRAAAYDNVMNKANELRVQNEKLSEDIWQKTLAERQANFDKAGKHDKIEPLQTIPIYQFEERQKKDPNYVKSLKEQGYLITTDKENGKVNLYPKTEIETRIVKNGLRTNEIVNKLGIGDKNLIDTEFADVIKGADEQHAYQTKQTLQDLMLDKGWSKEKAIDYLVNTKKLGTKEGLEKIYNTDFKDIDKNVRSYYAYGEDYIPSYLDKDGNMVNDTSLIGKWKDNDIITLARDRRFIDSYGANITSVSPNDNGSLEYGAQVLQKLRSGKWGWNPKTNSLVKLGADDAYKDLAIDPTEEDVNEISRIGDYRKLTNQQFNDKYYAPQSKIEKDWQKGKVPVQISANENYMATELGQDENGNTVDYEFGIEVPAGTDPNTGEVITKRVSASELAGKTVYMTEEEADKYRRARVKSNMGAVSRNPLWYAPAMIGAQPFAGGVLGATLNYAPISSMPWLTAGNALTAEMAYTALKPQGDFHQAYKDFKKGDVWEGIGNSLWGALGVAPLGKTAFKTFRALNDLKKPGGMGLIPTRSNLQYSISGQRGAAGKTGLDQAHVEDVRKKTIARLQSEDYLKKRMANTGETAEQVKADVKKIISEAENTKYNLNASLSPNIMGEQRPKGLQNLWRYPTVDISKTAENPITTLIHENNHLYSPAGYTSNMAPLIKGWRNPNIASVPFGKNRGVYTNYPKLGVTDDIGEYEAREWEQQVRHLNARDQLISANNLAEDAKVTPEMVEKFGQDWFKRIKTEGHVADDYDIIWESELKNVRETLAKEKGFANTTELEKNLTQTERSAFLKEVRKRWSEKVAGVLNSAWMGVPAVIGVGALSAGATDAEFKKGGFPKNIGKLKKFTR
jgi:hypothetical protein